jgi:integrase
MTNIIPVPQEEAQARLRRLALEGISSNSTRRAYSAAMDEFLTWAQYQIPAGFSKALVQQYKSMLFEKQLAPSTINQRLAAVRRLAFEAADNGLLDPSIAAAIGRVQGVRSCGIRLGHWLGQEDVERLLRVPGGESIRALRDGAILALLFGGGLRRSEATIVTVEQFRMIEERWVIVDLTGKHGRVRSVPIPSWTKNAVDEWTKAAGITTGVLFRQIDKCGYVRMEPLGPQTIYNIVRQHGAVVDPEVRPHDLRRSFARLAYENDASIEQLSMTLGHSSVATTERYVGARQNFRVAPCDLLKLDLRKKPASDAA